jgi:leucyl-tRNA synthetase
VFGHPAPSTSPTLPLSSHVDAKFLLSGLCVAWAVQAPPAKELEWDEDTLVGQVRWIRRLEALVGALEGSTPDALASPLSDGPGSDDARVRSAVHASIAEVTKCMDDTCSFNGGCSGDACP